MIKNHRWQIGGIVVLFALSISINVFPGFRGIVKKTFGFHEHQVLSTLKGYQVAQDIKIDVFKIKRDGEIFVEIYKHKSAELIQRIPFQESFDGYFNHYGRSANLFINDIDGDRQPEVIVPLFNQNLVASLHVFKYSKKENKFHYYRP